MSTRLLMIVYSVQIKGW